MYLLLLFIQSLFFDSYKIFQNFFMTFFHWNISPGESSHRARDFSIIAVSLRTLRPIKASSIFDQSHRIVQ